MQLRVARLCLDCEDVHDGERCPVCASEAFAFLSRWVPAPERRTARRPAPPTVSSPSPARRALVGVGVLGAAAFAVTRWARAAQRKLEEAADRQVTGELK
jgi:hypothetical protein